MAGKKKGDPVSPHENLDFAPHEHFELAERRGDAGKGESSPKPK